MVYFDCLPTHLNPLAERTCFSQVLGPRSCLMLLTANKADGEEGHVMAIKTAVRVFLVCDLQSKNVEFPAFSLCIC